MLKLLLLDMLATYANPSVYRNFNLSGIDVESRNSMLEPLESNPMLSITTALLDNSMLSSSDRSDANAKKIDKSKKHKKPKKPSADDEEDSRSNVSLNPKVKDDDDDSE